MQTDLSTRLDSVLGGDTLPEIARKMAAEGCIISPQAIHKWRRGGPISEENLLCLCRVYKVSPAWLRYGVGEPHPSSAAQQTAGELIDSLPAPTRQETLDFIEWKIQRDPLVDREAFGRYLRMIDRIRRDRDGLGGSPSPAS